MVRKFIRADTTTPPMAPRINYPEGWYANAAKITVKVYDDDNRKCLAELDDDALFEALMATGRVTELTEAEMLTELTRLRPPPPEVEIRLTGKAVAQKTDIENLLKAKGLTYKIEAQLTEATA